MKKRLLLGALGIWAAQGVFAATLSCSPIGIAQESGIQLGLGGVGCGANLEGNGEVGLPGGAPVTVPGAFALESFSVLVDTDPFVDYILSVRNLGATPLLVSLLVTSPYTGGPYDTLLSSHQLGVTDSGAFPNGTVTIATVAPETFVHQPFVDGGNVDGLNTGCVLAPGAGGSATCFASGPAQSFLVGPTPAAGTFGVRVTFTVSPGDLATASGRVELVASTPPGGEVPEPGTITLFGLGLVGLGLWQRRRLSQN